GHWSTSGLCTYLPAFRDGDMVALRSPDGQRGVSERHIPRLANRAAAYIGSDPAQVRDLAAPALLVEDVEKAILDLGQYARGKMAAKVVGVTGSAGKTSTVAMLAHAMEGYGAVGTTRHNANLPHGIAWNLASIPWDVPHVALELA